MSVIQQLSQQLNRLAQNINIFNANLMAARAKRREYERRISELQSIRGKMTGSLTSKAEDTQSKQKQTIEKLNSAVQKHSHVGALSDAIRRDQEKSFTSDNSGAQMIAYVDREIFRCQQEIEQACREERAAQSNIDNARVQQNVVRNRIQQERAKEQQGA